MLKSTELIFKLINHCLRPLEVLLVQKYHSPLYPVIFIVGLPRCGSTLFQQILAQRFEIGYICNLQARFWLIPYIGACLVKKILPKKHLTDFSSEFGITKGVWEPNEWGYFWRKALNIDTTTGHCCDTKGFMKRLEFLSKELAALEAVYKAPLIFDNVYIFPYIRDISRKIEKALFVYIKRDNFYVANSILNGRAQRYGDISKWYGPLPHDYQSILALSPVEQCVAHAYSVKKEIHSGLDAVNTENIFYVEYDDMCSDPRKCAKQFSRFIEEKGFKLKEKNGEIPLQFENRNNPERVNPLYREELEACYRKYYSEACLQNVPNFENVKVKEGE